MIFSIKDHVNQIIEGKKTQTRRASGRYEVGSKYSIQLKYGRSGIPDGKIKIIDKKMERRNMGRITAVAARKEGGYTPKEFEALYVKMYPNWKKRYAYTFVYVPTTENLSDKYDSG